MIINVSYDKSINDLQSSNRYLYTEITTAVDAAVHYYDHVFTNPVTLNIQFAWSDYGWDTTKNSGLLGHNNTVGDNFTYAQIYNAFKSHQTSADAVTAFNTLTVSDPTKGGKFWVTQAEEKALGLSPSQSLQPHPAFQAIDGVVQLNSNSNVGWTFDPSNRGVANEADAVGVLEDEISEVMGRNGSLGKYEGANTYTPLDLFRYSSPGVRQLTPGAGSFSIDGKNLLMKYNDPTVTPGDAADWAGTEQGGSTGDSFGGTYYGNVGNVSPTDLREMNVLGWDRAWGSKGTTADDFTGNGVSDIMFHSNTTGDSVFYDLQNTKSHWTDIGTLPTSYDLMGSGDFFGRNVGTHTCDMVLQNHSTGDLGFWHVNDDVGGWQHGWYDIGSKPGYGVAAIGDFTHYGSSEVLLENYPTGDIGFFKANALGGYWIDIGACPTDASGTRYDVEGAGDFTGHGRDDILFRNDATGQMGYWELDSSNAPHWYDIGQGNIGGAGSYPQNNFPDASYKVVGIGDFNGDGHQEILMSSTTVHPGYLDVGCYDVKANQWHDFGILSTSAMQVAGTGDYLGNGTSDVLLYNASNGDTGYYAIKNFGLAVDPMTGSAWHDIGTTNTSYHIVS